MPLETFPHDSVMQAIAAENNLSETAFLVADAGDWRLRWFTPVLEVPLCGHATLASAAAVMERLQPGRTSVVFHSASGPLTVKRTREAYLMDLPARASRIIAAAPGLVDALGTVPLEVAMNEFNYLARLETAAAVRTLAPDMALIAQLDRNGLIVTAPGDAEYDFVSRYFAPAKGIPEDPVTGAAHCMLAPYWAQRSGKNEFHAFQASSRGGELHCRVVGSRVEIEGACVFYLEGEVEF